MWWLSDSNVMIVVPFLVSSEKPKLFFFKKWRSADYAFSDGYVNIGRFQPT